MNKIYIAIVLVLVLVSCKKELKETIEVTCNYSDTSSVISKSSAYMTIVDSYVKKGLPGISVLIEDSNGTFVYSKGYADIENKIKYSPCHISKAASITKLLIGALTFKLIEEGKLSLDDDVEKYVDSKILDKIDNGRGHKIRNLMNHTTGIFDVIRSSDFYLAVLNNPNKRWRQEELLKFVYGIDGHQLNNPYPAFYSSTNTLLLSMCIEKATGEDHGKLLREKILNPLGLSNTYYQGREDIPTNAAQGYYDLHNNGTIMNVSNLITGSGNGYGGIFSNVFDLKLFIQELLVKKTVISQESLNTMLEFVRESDDYYTGVGIVKKYTDKKNYGIGHTGKDLGYTANLFYFPERNITMVFFINYGTNGDSSLKPVFLDFESDLVNKILE